MKRAIAADLSRRMPAITFIPSGATASVKRLEFIRIEDCLGLKELRSCRRFLPELVEGQIKWFRLGCGSSSGEKQRGPFKFFPGQIKTACQPLHAFQQLDRVEIKNCFAFAVIAE